MNERSMFDKAPHGDAPATDSTQPIPVAPAAMYDGGYVPSPPRTVDVPPFEPSRRASVFDGCAGQVLFATLSAFVFGAVSAAVCTFLVSLSSESDLGMLLACAFFTFFGFGFVGFVAGFMFQGARGWHRAYGVFKREREMEQARQQAISGGYSGSEGYHPGTYPTPYPQEPVHVDVGVGDDEYGRY